MDFIQYITTPESTTAADPQITTLKLTRGRLHSGWIFFPSGPAGELHFQAKIESHQISPFNADESIHLNDCVVPLSFGIDLSEPPFEIKLITWNLSTLYAHALSVCISIIPKGRKGFNLDTLANEFAGTNGYHKP